MSDFISDTTKKLDLDNGKWVELRNEVSYENIFAIQSISDDDPVKITKMLLAVISSWNLSDDKGVVEITEENIRKMKSNYIAKILIEIPKLFNNTEEEKKK